jgi:hypothetical protein
MEVTTLEQLQEYAKGSIVKLPDFAEGQPFVVRMKKPSLISMLASNQIPNELMNVATELFEGGNKKKEVGKNQNNVSDLIQLCRLIAKESLIQPSLDEITDVGLNLSDEQFLAIFDWTQGGVKTLTPFREEPTGSKPDSSK